MPKAVFEAWAHGIVPTLRTDRFTVDVTWRDLEPKSPMTELLDGLGFGIDAAPGATLRRRVKITVEPIEERGR